MFGDVDRRTQRQLALIASGGRCEPEATVAYMLPNGVVLIRDWHGIKYRVEVTEGGYLYDGRLYRSLSAISRSITGTTWSGPVFFGLKKSGRDQ